MSKYANLHQWLLEARGDRTPLTFFELETLLEFPLPASARTHRPWWANTASGHSHASAWLDAGWRTADVDLVRERLVFERKPAGRAQTAAPPPAPAASPTETVVIPRALLSAEALRLLDELSRVTAGDTASAAAALLNQAALERRLQQAMAAPDPAPVAETQEERPAGPPRLGVVINAASRRA
jgi:hypothetical protein